MCDNANMLKVLLNTLYTILIIFLAALGLLLAATLIPFGNVEVKIVQSGSMEPAIEGGSIIAVKSADSYAVGDVITFGKDTKTQIPTTHRIVDSREENGQTVFTVKGDANDEPDPNPVYASSVIGKVWFSVPRVGYLLDFARKPLGFGLLVGIPALMLVVDEGEKIVREVMAMRRKKDEQT